MARKGKGPPPEVQQILDTGLKHHTGGDLTTAEGLYRDALKTYPDHPAALHLLGVIAYQRGQLDNAVDLITQALAISPDFAEAHNNLGNVYRDQGNLDEAATSYGKALDINPEYVKAHNNLGLVLKDQGNLKEAIPRIRQAIALDPDYAEAYSNLGVALKEQGNIDEAVASYGQALAIRPDYADAHNNLGNALRWSGRVDEAVENFQKALALQPANANAHSNLGNALKDLGKFDEAAASYQKALDINPDYAEAHTNIGLLHLLRGHFEEGWEDYAWRWLENDSPSRRQDLTAPLWDGSDLDGKTIYLYAEQGLGDVIQFVRFMPLVADRGGRVILELPPKLDALLRGVEGADTFVSDGDPMPAIDCHAPLLDLPGLLKTTVATIPSRESYLTVEPGLVEKWAERLGPKEDFRVGIIWGGNPGQTADRTRSMDPALLKPLTEIPGITVYSLQFGRDGEAAKYFGDAVIDIGPELTPLTEAAAAVMNLDLVVTVDTSSAHLSGALGRPVWTLLSFIPDWRWLLDRDDTPWYPSMRLFRQQQPGDWDGVIERVREALINR